MNTLHTDVFLDCLRVHCIRHLPQLYCSFCHHHGLHGTRAWLARTFISCHHDVIIIIVIINVIIIMTIIISTRTHPPQHNHLQPGAELHVIEEMLEEGDWKLIADIPAIPDKKK